MRSSRIILVVVGVLQFVLAAGFFFQQPWATGLWPVPDTRLSYAFIAAILAGGAAPSIWIGLSGKLGALAGYGLAFGLMYAGMGVTAARFFMRDGNPALGSFALVMGLLAALGAVLFLRFRRSTPDEQSMPQIVRWAFAVEVIVLLGAGTLLALKVPNTLPWKLSDESSVLYGWVFIGLAFYYLFAVINNQWLHALGPLLGFLVYDLVLAGPLFARFGSLQPEHVRGQVAASLIIIFTIGLGVYYLLINPETRLGARVPATRLGSNP